MVTSSTKQIHFTIEHNDSLGQGVSKIGDKIVFIPKTLSGESGKAGVVKFKKGVSFARMQELEIKSPKRVVPECEHFSECGGCHYLHTDYENELNIKKENLQRLFKNYLNDEVLEIIKAPNRFFYRNRIQLQYDKKQRKLGFFTNFINQVVHTPNCIIAVKEIQSKLDQLFQDDQWLKSVIDQPEKGTIELYFLNNKIHTSFNGNHAHLGFTQVNQEMNHHLKKWVQTNHTNQNYTLELFGGDGNLTKHIDNDSKLVVDQYEHNNKLEQYFFNQDIYHNEAIEQVQKRIPAKIVNLVLDPPRSGLKNLNQWISELNIKEITYISCNPATFKRDIDSIKSKIKSSKIVGIDLFPGTYHMEIASHFILH